MNKSLKINAILNIIYTIVNILFPLITFPYVSRILLVENIGKVNFFNSLANYAIVFGSLGISTYGIRAVARVKDDEEKLNKVTQELLFLNIIATIVVTVLLLISSIFVTKFKDNILLFSIYLFYILVSPAAINWLYSGLEQYKYITKRALLIKLISFAAIFIFIKNKDDVIIYSLVLILANVAGYICNIIHSKTLVNYKKTKLEFREHIKPMLILFASILAVYVYIHLDTLMLGFICGDFEVGLYTVAVYVKTALLNIVNAISVVLLPRMSYYISNGNDSEGNKLIRKSTTIIFILSVPLTAFFIQNAFDSIMFLGGTEYIGSVRCMQIIMPILLLSGFSNILGNQILIPRGKEKWFLLAVSCGAFVDIIFNAVLMPNFGCIGAAVATLMAETMQMSIQLYASRKYLCNNINHKSIVIIIVATLVAFAGTMTISRYIDFNPLLNLTLNGIIFFVIYGIILIISREEESYAIVNGIKEKIT